MGLIARVCSLPGVFRGLHESGLDPDPFRQFAHWFRFAKCARVYMPNAMALATASADGHPSVRMMLLKGHDKRGFTFFTNYESRKGQELSGNPNASLVLHWVDLHRQVRAEGRVERLTVAESDAYFQTRPRGSRIGAWASKQSTVIPDRGLLRTSCEEIERKYKGHPVPLPPFWGGFRIVPERIEFWQGRAYRLHDRLCYVREGDGWCIERLSP
ncbi:MAG: pyridoxamine 5'-phosphate oxidase [bacterium]